jgi:hypothetical protein
MHSCAPNTNSRNRTHLFQDMQTSLLSTQRGESEARHQPPPISVTNIRRNESCGARVGNWRSDRLPGRSFGCKKGNHLAYLASGWGLAVGSGRRGEGHPPVAGEGLVGVRWVCSNCLSYRWSAGGPRSLKSVPWERGVFYFYFYWPFEDFLWGRGCAANPWNECADNIVEYGMGFFFSSFFLSFTYNDSRKLYKVMLILIKSNFYYRIFV